ncbi:SO_0444 family Cu/Zn efflux transporter [bacterium]|nr:SO_0444 family Cu/Zn efflux transporter [bacterium]
MNQAGILFGAFLLSILHAGIPNHWGPFVVVGRLRGWSRPRQAWITWVAGFLHSTVTLAIGIAIAYAGGMVESERLDLLHFGGAVILVLLGFVLIFSRLFNRHPHRHFDPSRISAASDALWVTALVGMLALSPCAEILPLYILAAADGWSAVLSLSVVVVLSTSLGMTGFVLFFGEKLSRMRWTWIEENSGLVAGLVLVALGIFAASEIEGTILPQAQAAGNWGLEVLRHAWTLFQEAAPYVLFGCLMGGLVYGFIQPDRVARYLGKGKFRPVVNAALLGIPLPLCSCGVIPAALTLRRMGASRGATTAFLITTPETGIDSIFVTYGLLGPIYAVFRPLAAFLTGVTAGVMEVLFGEKELPRPSEPEKKETECSSCASEPKPVMAAPASVTLTQKLKLSVTYGLGEFLADIALWLVIGFLAAGLILALVPPAAIERTIGGGLPGMIVVLIVSVPLYICASAATPLAAALLLQGASPGAALVLLLAGPASNTAGIVLLYKFLGKRSVIIYILSIVLCSLSLGLLLNHLFLWFGTTPSAEIGSHHLASSAPGAGRLAAVILAVLICYHLAHRLIRSITTTETPQKERHPHEQ